MKYVYVVFLVLISFTANAQQIACIKTPQMINASCTMSPPSRSDLPEQFGFITIKNGLAFNFRWRDKLNILSGFKDSQLSESIVVVKMDNDSVMTFKPMARFSRVESPMFQNGSLSLYIESDATEKELINFKNHKALSLTLITAKKDVKYDLFLFSDQNKTDIQRTADCFLGRLSEK